MQDKEPKTAAEQPYEEPSRPEPAAANHGITRIILIVVVIFAIATGIALVLRRRQPVEPVQRAYHDLDACFPGAPMTASNSQIAEAFREMADLLEISGANPFRVRAYRNAASAVEEQPRSLSDMVANSADLTELPSIGADLAKSIRQLVQNGQFDELEAVKQQINPSLRGLMRIPGLGPKRVKRLHDELHIYSVDDLRIAVEKQRLRSLPGFSKKIEEQVAQALETGRTKKARRLISEVDETAKNLERYLLQIDEVEAASIAGSYRRRKETVRDLDAVAATKHPAKVIDAFVHYPDNAEVVSHGDTRASVVLKSGLAVDLRAVKPESYGAALDYFTGSKEHQIALRNLAVDRGWKLNEYGVFNKNGKQLGGRTEAELYRAFGLPYIEPELREDRGEIEAGFIGDLPNLITQDEIKGDLHCHTNWSDGKSSLEEMTSAAKALGYAYMAITDHSPRLRMTKGLTPERLREQAQEIERANEQLAPFTVLRGCEVDILKDGSLDLPDEMLAELEIVICSIHSHFNFGREAQTARMVKAIEHPHTMIIGHPQGRLLERRDPIQLDLEIIFAAAAANKVAMEINADPKRLDLDDSSLKLAKEMGVKFTISTDAHSMAGLHNMRYGIGQARRGWLEAGDVHNTLSLSKLRKALRSSIPATSR